MLNSIVNIYRTVVKNIQYNNQIVEFIGEILSTCKQINAYGDTLVSNRRLKTLLKHLQYRTGKTRLNTIYELEQIAHNYPQYHWLIMEILCKFIYAHAASTSSSPLDSCSTLLIQSALDVIARRNIQHDTENQQLDLCHIDIRGANLREANLENANLYRINLCGANLSQANLCGTVLIAADLSGANLAGANLSYSILSAANLTGANLSRTNLTGANLYLASLQEAILYETKLNGANLREVKFTTSDNSNNHPISTQHL
ncbi:pentapeptide repeat-containing protein [Nostoc sp. MS1]|uniref:pentapeptide repeat-containing protein n=1 Tax=Nostoc sp. MS1 TaxID=2764711 RepID=UPI001CC57AF3|nr:pentapeptide repeat-containing protein [Nostoc sp. MS1]BCL38974.1 hypothetical protein NSMS1_54210 [Nostoc sp. MS1]BCL39837.1 hypothetical protein NSMS1_62840 [Nostoc sp. MS1]